MKMRIASSLLVFVSLCLAPLCVLADAPAREKPRKIVLIAGKKSHGPAGNGIHDYGWSVQLLKVMLDNSTIKEHVRVEYHLDGWPEDPKTLDDADTIMIVSDGRDGNLYEEAPHLASPERVRYLDDLMKKGCGFLTFHFSTFTPNKHAEQVLGWSGGYFQWETEGKKQWYSAIRTLETDVKLGSADHPIARGLTPFRMREEFYYNIRFRAKDDSLKPIWTVPALGGRAPDGNVVAWARERKGGGRGFGTTCGHFYDNWKQEQFRRMILNALAWTARVEVPKDGVAARFYSHEEIRSVLAGVKGTERAVVDDRPIRVLLFAGNDAHKWHNWEKTTPAIKAALERDPRIKVEVSHDIEDLARKKLGDYQVIVQNYVNWHDPKELSEASRSAFVKYLEDGGGLIVVHFANGAFHFSLPKAEKSDWPGYRKIVRRVWNHHGQGKVKSGHDSFGRFVVRISEKPHAITAGLKAFEVTDELYFHQDGDEKIEPLLVAESKVTKQLEPLAWSSTVGKGRVFQTLLGHSEKTYDTFEPREMLRRAAAWAAARPLRPLTAEEDRSATVPLPAKDPLSEGRFGKALDARVGPAVIAGRDDFCLAPFTAECWAKLLGKRGYNILLACDTKASAAHWELFTMPASGNLTAYLPGRIPDHVNSAADVCDGRWHHLAMICEAERVRLFVDGKLVADLVMKSKGGTVKPGTLSIGALVERSIACEGLIDEVRLSKGVRVLTAVPEKPVEADAATLGLWRFDSLTDGKFIEDESPARSRATPGPPATSGTSAPPGMGDHWGQEAVGFRWTENDSRDDRWKDMEMGRFLASSLPLPGNSGIVAKGLSIRLGDRREAAVCFDTEHLKLRAAWTGGFLRFTPARFGLIAPPEIAGPSHFVTGGGPGWAKAEARYTGLHVHGERVVLAFIVTPQDGKKPVAILESPWFETRDGQGLFTRTCEVAASSVPLTMTLADLVGSEKAELRRLGNRELAVIHSGNRVGVLAVNGEGVRLTVPERGPVALTLAASAKPLRFKLVQGSAPSAELAQLTDAIHASPQASDLQPLLRPGPARWTASITTKGSVAPDTTPFAVDTLTLPFDNPYRALMFVGGHDFFSNGDIALCTVHGDVWRVSGVDERLEKLVWKRLATGLYQPLGLKILADRVYVLGRDQITRLHLGKNGEVDFFENFCNLARTSPGGHDYSTCLESDSAGNLYFLSAQDGVLKVSPEGRTIAQMASGFRNPNGLGVSPGGVITVAPQEGEWTPASSIAEVKPGGWYGFTGPRVAPGRPLGYDPPLCWIPRRSDNSSGGQVWVTGDRWASLSGQLLHLSYGQCRMLLALRENPAPGVVQGGTVELPPFFSSGAMRGRFSPRDGQLYVSGLKGWVTAATQDGSLQRVRRTSKPLDLPTRVRTMQNGLAITFSRALNRATAQDPGSYHLEQWNYRYSAAYGSAEYRVAEPRQEGRDPVRVTSATLLEDGKTVFLELPQVVPVMQLAIGFTLEAADGSPIRQTIHYTINAVGSERMDPSKLARATRLGLLTAEEEAKLRPGLLLRFEQGKHTDTRESRLAALFVPRGEAATPFLEPGPFRAPFQGYLRIPLRTEVSFSLRGRGDAVLRINGKEVSRGTGDLMAVPPVRVALPGGYSTLSLDYTSPTEGEANLRLLWEGAEFPQESVPPTVLFHRGDDASLLAGQRLRRGRELFATRNCARCHGLPEGVKAGPEAMPELALSPPGIAGAGERLQADWLASWLLDPQSLQRHAAMPRLVKDRQSAADLAVYLGQLRLPKQEPQKDVKEGHAGAGRKLYEDLACIACHRLTAPTEKDAFERVSLHHVTAKYRPGMLEDYLARPQAHHAASKMPDFRLSVEEIANLAAYLRQEVIGKIARIAELNRADPKRGRELFLSLRCVNCHETGATGDRPGELVQLKKKAGGCLAAERRPVIPVQPLAEPDRAALTSFLATEGRSLARRVAGEDARRFERQLNCTACHGRDAVVSPRVGILADEGRGIVPEVLPTLTWAGEKLRPAWTESFLAGTVAWRPRPTLKARMPAFPSHAAVLARGFAAQHGVDPAETRRHVFDRQQAAIGDRLTRKTALDCRQCHAVGREPITGDERTQLAVGLNFAHAAERLREEFYLRFVLNPPRYDPLTKMPKFIADGRTTKVANVLGGDSRKQLAAIWHYLQAIDLAPPR